MLFYNNWTTKLSIHYFEFYMESLNVRWSACLPYVDPWLVILKKTNKLVLTYNYKDIMSCVHGWKNIQRWNFGWQMKMDGLVTIGKIKESFKEFTINLCFFHKTHKIFGNFQTLKTKGHTKLKNWRTRPPKLS